MPSISVGHFADDKLQLVASANSQSNIPVRLWMSRVSVLLLCLDAHFLFLLTTPTLLILVRLSDVLHRLPRGLIVHY